MKINIAEHTGVWTITGQWYGLNFIPTPQHHRISQQMYDDFSRRLNILTKIYENVTVQPSVHILSRVQDKLGPNNRLQLDVNHLRWTYLFEDEAHPRIYTPILMYAPNALAVKMDNAGRYNFGLLPCIMCLLDRDHRIDTGDMHPNVMTYNIISAVNQYVNFRLAQEEKKSE